MDTPNFKDLAIKNMQKSASPDSSANILHMSRLYSRLSKNKHCLYLETDSDKETIFKHINNRFAITKNTPDEVKKTGKNLLYFSVFHDIEYIGMLYKLLASIEKNTTNLNFDILIMTDEKFKQGIEVLPIVSKFKVDYMLFNGVKTAMDASMKKMFIYDYNRIDEYEKILYLDADSLCLKDLNIIFESQREPEKLYVSYPPYYTSSMLFTISCGLAYLSYEDAEYLYENPDIKPFNGGQFFFINSKRMQMHFDNVVWLYHAWPGYSFYEQSLLNQYFVFRGLSSSLIGDDGKMLIEISYNPNKKKKCGIPEKQVLYLNALARSKGKSILTVTGATNSNFANENMHIFSFNEEDFEELYTTQWHTDSTVVLHFATTTPHGKRAFIENYANAYKLHI